MRGRGGRLVRAQRAEERAYQRRCRRRAQREKQHAHAQRLLGAVGRRRGGGGDVRLQQQRVQARREQRAVPWRRQRRPVRLQQVGDVLCLPERRRLQLGEGAASASPPTAAAPLRVHRPRRQVALPAEREVRAEHLGHRRLARPLHAVPAARVRGAELRRARAKGLHPGEQQREGALALGQGEVAEPVDQRPEQLRQDRMRVGAPSSRKT